MQTEACSTTCDSKVLCWCIFVVSIHVKSLDLLSCISSIIHTCYTTMLVCCEFIHHIILRKEHILETGSVSGSEIGEEVLAVLCLIQRAILDHWTTSH